MRKSTAAISLVLLGTAVALAGCSRNEDDEERREGGGGGHVGGVYHGARIGTGIGRTGGGTATAAPSVRGGFGGTASGAAS